MQLRCWTIELLDPLAAKTDLLPLGRTSHPSVSYSRVPEGPETLFRGPRYSRQSFRYSKPTQKSNTDLENYNSTSLPAGAGPSVTPDTAADFQGFDAFHVRQQAPSNPQNMADCPIESCCQCSHAFQLCASIPKLLCFQQRQQLSNLLHTSEIRCWGLCGQVRRSQRLCRVQPLL